MWHILVSPVLHLYILTQYYRKANWDLKRDVEKKLTKLEKRTKRAMAELIREKLRAEKDMSVSLNTRDETNDSD